MPRKYDHEDDRQEKPVEVAESKDQNRPYWISRPYLTDDVKASIERAAVVILPREGFRDYQGPVFPVGTEEIFHLLKTGLPAGSFAEIATNDDDYHELALHSATLILGAFLVTSIVAPLVVNLLSDYVNRRCSSDEKATVRFEMKVEDGAGRTASISYDGPAKQFGASVGNAVELLRSRGPEAPTLPASEESDDRK